MLTHKRVVKCPVPEAALLARYEGQGWTYTDCYTCVVPLDVDFDAFVSAFYTTWLFRIERLILSYALRRVFHDNDIGMLLGGQRAGFAVWRVERRGVNEILLHDESFSTRSWFGVQRLEGGGTRLLFGSAIVAGSAPLHPFVRMILPLHMLYSKALLGAARQRLVKGAPASRDVL